LLLQEINSVAFALGEHCDQQVCPGHLLVARGSDVNCRALKHALKARGGFRVVAMRRDKIGKLVVDVIQHLPAQPIEVEAACAQDGNRVLVFGKRKQQMFKSGVFVAPLIRLRESSMQRLFEIA
jgi:hypothetical protein